MNFFLDKPINYQTIHNQNVSNTIVVCVIMISLICLRTLTIIAITFGLLAFVFPNIWMLKAAILTGPF